GIFSAAYPFIRPPRLFDITSEQTRALRSRMLIDAILGGRLRGSIVRLGRSPQYVDQQLRRDRSSNSAAFLSEAVVSTVARYPTNATRMAPANFELLLRHGFETADATLTGYMPQEFPRSILWADVVRQVAT